MFQNLRFFSHCSKVFVNAEDATLAGAELKGVQDEDVERIRRSVNTVSVVWLFYLLTYLFNEIINYLLLYSGLI